MNLIKNPFFIVLSEAFKKTVFRDIINEFVYMKKNIIYLQCVNSTP